MSKDYYNILGVQKNASQEEIKKVFRQKAHQYHPDKKGGDEGKFKEINEAYQVLGDVQKKAQYDQFGSGFENAQSYGGFHGFEGFRDASGFASGFNINMDDLGDVFEGVGDIFGFGRGGARGRTGPSRGNDIQTILTINFNEAIFGVEKEVGLHKTVKCDKCAGNGAEPGTNIETCKVCRGSGRVSKIQRTILGNIQIQTTCHQCGGEGEAYTQKCSKCHGHGIVRELAKLKVKIPAGIDNGETIRLSGHGEAGQKGGPAGDLYLQIKVNPDARFERDGYDILSKAEINFTQAALGDKIEIETIYGAVKLKIPEGTQSATVFKLRNKGIVKLHGRGHGDHLVKVIVKTPKNLSRKQKQLLREL